ncbi:MAG: Hsp20/alpha crystallin family protein [Treponema sp.]|nr:Hsp20/alpha crystallin family protein [Treponema sp.]
MKGSSYMDLSTIFDEIFEAAQGFGEEIKRNLNQYNEECGDHGPMGRHPRNPFGGPRGPFGPGFEGKFKYSFDENTDYYPNYSYPPMNVYMREDRSMVFEFALAGFEEQDISLSFQGDYMVFSASLPSGEQVVEENTEEKVRYFKRRLKMKNIEKQKYFVPLDKYAQDQVKAVFKNGVLKVSIPPKDEPDLNDGVRIEIVKDGN